MIKKGDRQGGGAAEGRVNGLHTSEEGGGKRKENKAVSVLAAVEGMTDRGCRFPPTLTALSVAEC